VAAVTVPSAPQLPDDLVAWLDRLIRLSDIPDLFGVRLVTVKVWRGNGMGGTVGADQDYRLNVLPDPVALPGPLGRLVRDPMWDREVLLEWGRQTGRLDLRNRPIRLGPPGRPRTRPPR
jgi:hypothetical protein